MKSFLKNYRVISLLFFVFINIFIFYIIYSSHFGKLKVSFLNIGQGDSILIESPVGNQILIDGGMNSKVLEAVGKGMPFYDRSIDMVIATHPDVDHIGGLPVVLEKYKVQNYFDNGVQVETALFNELNRKVVNKKLDYFQARSGDLVDIGGGAFLRILSPDNIFGSDTNKNSIIAKLYFGNTSMMLTGDAPKEIESILAKKYGAELKSDILKVAHHGSRNSLAESFLSAVSPEISIISVNKDNQYGHPHIEVLDFLKEIGSKILMTYEEGNIVFKSDGWNISSR